MPSRPAAPDEQQHLEHSALDELELEGVEHEAESNRYSFPLQAWTGSQLVYSERAARAAPRPRAGPSPPSHDRHDGAGPSFPPGTRTTGTLERRPYARHCPPPRAGAPAQQAKDLVRERKAGAEPIAPERRAASVAREYGFASWPRLKAYVERVSAHGPGLTHAFVDEIGYYEDRADGLRSVVASGLENGIAVVRAHHPDARGCERGRNPRAQRRGRAPRARARARLRELGAVPPPRAGSGRERRAVPARVQGDRGAGSHGARRAARPLSGARRGARDERQRPARARVGHGRRSHDLVRELLARGADPSSANDRGWTPLHQAGYGNDVELARMLLEAGARTDLYGHGEGGTPLAAALFWGHAEVAELLAERAVVPRNLRIAAGPRQARPDPRSRQRRRQPERGRRRGARLLPAAHGLSDLAAVR